MSEEFALSLCEPSIRVCRFCSQQIHDGFRGLVCKGCRRVINRRKYLANREAILARTNAYYAANRAAQYAATRKRTKAVALEKPLMGAFYQARSRAKKEGAPFSIRYDDLPQPPDRCPVLGIPIVYHQSKRTGASPSIDKIIPYLGYIPGNVAVISFRANCIKRDASPAEIEMIGAYFTREVDRICELPSLSPECKTKLEAWRHSKLWSENASTRTYWVP